MAQPGRTAAFTYPLVIPSASSYLKMRLAPLDASADARLTFTVTVRDQNGRQRRLFSRTMIGSGRVFSIDKSLKRFKGKRVSVRVEAKLSGNDRKSLRTGIIHPVVTSGLPGE